MKISEHNSLKTLNHASSLAHAAALALLALSAFAPNGCRHADEPPPPPLTEGKRDYVWTIDTLAAVGEDGIQFFANDIWGTSPSNLYVVGENNNNQGSVRHFDGNRWTTIKVSKTEGGPIPEGCEFRAIWGSAANDIWIVGERDGFYSRIVHYDGAHWADMNVPRKGSLAAVWGASSNDVWVGGGGYEENDGVMFHWDGAKWTQTAFDSTLHCRSIVGFSSSDVYATCDREISGAHSIPSARILLLHWGGESWSVVDSFLYPAFNKFGIHLFATEPHKLFSSGVGIFEYDFDGAWTTALPSENNLRIGGSHRFNIFAASDFGEVYHYNGTDWKNIPTPFGESCFFSAVWTDNVQTFIIGGNGWRSFVLHGR